MNLKIKPIKLTYTKSNVLNGAIVYSIGDLIAALVLNEFEWTRFLGMAFIGATIYAFEIPNYFNWIEKRTVSVLGLKRTLLKTVFAIAYFNPLWIARHLLFIKIVTWNLDGIQWSLLEIAFWSFLVNIPISFMANFVIQNKIKLSNRFIASAIFSGLMAIYYALSETWFG